MRLSLITAASCSILMAMVSAATAQTAFDASSMGSVIVGYDSRNCDASIEGAIRYNSSVNSLQVCTQSTGNCPNIGDSCGDTAIYAGLSPDGNVPMYTTPADAPGGYAWNDGSSNWVDIATMANCTNGTPGTASSCQTGAANTALLAGLGTSPSPAPYDAAQYCASLAPPDAAALGHDDWYLPAQDELNVLWENLVDQDGDDTPGGPLGSTFGFNTSGSNPAGWYWSSSENSNALARSQRFSDGPQGNDVKSKGSSIRCVRTGVAVTYGWADL